jgi:hypothetical protein
MVKAIPFGAFHHSKGWVKIKRQYSPIYSIIASLFSKQVVARLMSDEL